MIELPTFASRVYFRNGLLYYYAKTDAAGRAKCKHLRKTDLGQKSHKGGSNSRPLHYECNALPLSYRGHVGEDDRRERGIAHSIRSATMVPVRRTDENAARSKKSHEGGSNSRPLHYECNALPLSYRGAHFTVEI